MDRDTKERRFNFPPPQYQQKCNKYPLLLEFSSNASSKRPCIGQKDYDKHLYSNGNKFTLPEVNNSDNIFRVESICCPYKNNYGVESKNIERNIKKRIGKQYQKEMQDDHQKLLKLISQIKRQNEILSNNFNQENKVSFVPEQTKMNSRNKQESIVKEFELLKKKYHELQEKYQKLKLLVNISEEPIDIKNDTNQDEVNSFFQDDGEIITSQGLIESS